MSDLLTTEDVARWLVTSTRTIQRYARAGELHPVDGMYDRADVEAFLEAHRST